MQWAGVHIVAPDAVSILAGTGGEVVSLGLPPPKHRSLSNLAPSERGTSHASSVSLGSREHPCLRPLHRNSHQRFSLLEAAGMGTKPL